jgi:thioesterase domain-containing protein
MSNLNATAISMEMRLEHELFETIPLVRALALKVVRVEHGLVLMQAPLAPNINDKGCAFGGSLASLLTLACWSVLRTHTWAESVDADIFIHTSRIIYCAPVWDAFDVYAQLKTDVLNEFMQSFRAKGKAAAVIHAEVKAGDVVAATMDARFVAMAPKTINA